MPAAIVSKPPPIPRRERLRQMMLDDVMTAARRIVQDEGFGALSMRALATEVGVTAPTIYEYFANKDAVLDALYLQGVATLQAQFDQIIASNRPSMDKIASLGYAYRDFAKAHPDLFLMVFGRVDASYQPGETQREAAMGLMSSVITAVTEAIEAGAMRPCDPETAGCFLWSNVHGWVMLEANKVMRKYSGEELEERFANHIRFTIEALGGPP